MKFKLNGEFITGHVDITDIKVVGGSGPALICESQKKTSHSSPPSSMGNWYLHHESESTEESDRLGDSDRGWTVTRTTTTDDYRQVKLRRHSASGSVEGVFTCQIENDNNPIRSLYVLYPSELLLTHHNISLQIQYYSSVKYIEIL